MLGTVAFAGIGLWMAGSWRAEATLAGANGLYLVLLLLGGNLRPRRRPCPAPLGTVTAFLPSAALAAAAARRARPAGGASRCCSDLIVLAGWAPRGPLLRPHFRWDRCRRRPLLAARPSGWRVTEVRT